jgi:hypothetical protein
MCFCACVTLEFATQSRMFDTTIELYNCFSPIVPTNFACLYTRRKWQSPWKYDIFEIMGPRTLYGASTSYT